MSKTTIHKFVFIILAGILFLSNAYGENTIAIPGDAQAEVYLPLLKNKRVAVFANQSSQVGNQNIVDVLVAQKVAVVKIFTPEHGFSVAGDAGAAIKNSGYHNIPIVSLYGKKTAPNAEDLTDVDVIVFDVQDVGVRYYTYISSLQRLMEAATINHKPLIIFDRPNPNGFYIDGPILEPAYKSFVGMQPVPIVYGMTIGEYAQMLVGEKWLDLRPRNLATTLKLTIVPLKNYTHNNHYQIQNPPSPNLPNMTAIYWYPSLGWFEGTKVSVGRGTAMPFQVLGAPKFPESYSFTPQATIGASNPPFKNQLCYGWNLQLAESQVLTQINGQIQLSYLLKSYHQTSDKAHFFNSYFNKLAGNASLQQQIIRGDDESTIRASWQSALAKFRIIRQKYLLYPDQ